MKSPGLLVNSFLFAVTAALASAPPCQVEEAPFRGWKSLRLSNGLVSLYVVPDLGGRVIQFQLGDHPFFFVNDDLAGKVFPPEENGGGEGGWKNYGGSKLWPAPQGWQNDTSSAKCLPRRSSLIAKPQKGNDAGQGL